MTPLPITLLDPTLSAVMRGECTALRRPATGALGKVRAGQLLWIREPFHLAAKFDDLSPTASAGMLGARCIYAADVRVPYPSDLGIRRPARTPLKIWHRQHLAVFEVGRERLQAITDAEVRAEGYRDRRQFELAWDRALEVGSSRASLPTHPMAWRNDPEVIVIRFRHVARSLPEIGR